jgi:hypothetical protein
MIEFYLYCAVYLPKSCRLPGGWNRDERHQYGIGFDATGRAIGVLAGHSSARRQALHD